MASLPILTACDAPTNADFSADAEPQHDLIRLRLAGFFTPEDISAFRLVMRSVYWQLTCAPNRHSTIVDVRDIKIQSQEAVVAFQALLAAPEFKGRRLACVVSPTLARSQIMRALGGRDARVFDALQPAEIWVLQD